MNKTVNINLGGIFFHIDEDAYQKLTRYFDAIKRSLSNSNGQEEIMNDIEIRISELLTERLGSDKQVVSSKNVDEVISIMGQPEDYRLDDEAETNGTTSSFTKTAKKLYRDKEKALVGGVLSGLGHYFGIDKVWLRILFLVLVFFYGTGILVYIVLWIVMPEAVTTSEKLEMTGEPVNISNIEKKVREEFENISGKIKGADYDALGRNAKTGAERAVSNLGTIIVSIFKVFAKVIGAFLVVIAASMLAGLVISLFTLGSTSFLHMPWLETIETMNYSGLPLWCILILFFFAIGIPFFFLFILGLKLLITNMKSLGNIVKYTLLAIWLITVGLLIAFGIQQAAEIGSEGKTVEKKEINITNKDTLFVKFRYSDFYAKNFDYNEEFIFSQDSAGKSVIYSNNVELHFMNTDEANPYIQIEKTGHGKSLDDAKKRADNIIYHYSINGNHLVLDNFLLTDIKNKYRKQQVKIFLYLPTGMILAPDSSVDRYTSTRYSNLYLNGYNENEDPTPIYMVKKDQLKCLNCPNEEEPEDLSSFEVLNPEETEPEPIDPATSKSITISENGIIVKDGNKTKSNKRIDRLEISKDGVIIKTK